MHINFDVNSPVGELIKFEDFLNVDIRIGQIIEVDDFPKARNPSYRLKIDFGPGVGVKKSCAQLTGHYTKDGLINKKVLAVVNFPPRQIANAISEVLVLGLSDQNKDVVLFELDHSVENGARLH